MGSKMFWNQILLKIYKISELKILIPILAWARLGRGKGVVLKNWHLYKSFKIDYFKKFKFLTCNIKVYNHFYSNKHNFF